MALAAKLALRVKRVADQVHDYLNLRLADDSLDIARLYRHHRDQLVMRLQHIYDSYLWDDPTLVKARTSGAATELDLAIHDVVNNLTNSVGRESVDRIARLIDMQPTVVHRAAGTKLFGPKLPLQALGPSTQSVLGELTTTVVGGGTFFDRLVHGNTQLKQQLARDVQTGLINGQTFDQVRAKVLKSFGVDKMRAPQGSAYGSVKHYQNAARAQWNRLMSKTARDLGGVEVWWAILEGPLARTTTPGCAARHGVPLNALGQRPPIHFNCRCTVTVLPAETNLAELQADGTAWLRAHGYS